MNLSTARLQAAVPKAVRELCQRLREAGHRSWVVGGCVRDELLSELEQGGASAARPRNDWDIATSALPEQVTAAFRRVIPTGIQHGTVTVLLGKEQFEVTTLRGETTYTDGRRPDSVYFVDDIRDDLARRDFTVNAIAYDVLEDRLIDPFDGLSDLKARSLKAVGEPAQRFAEDGLRVLRAARFVATLEFELDPKTASAIEPSLDSYRKVSSERIRDEWLKSMKAERPSRAFEVMRAHGLLAITAPELLESVGCVQNRYHAYDVWGHALACLDHCPKQPVLRMAGLFHDIGKPRSRAFSDKTNDYTFYEHERIGAEMAEPVLSRLRFSNDERARIVALVRHHLICYDTSWSDAAVRRWLRRVTPELSDDLYRLAEADVLGKGKEPSADLSQIAELKAHVARVIAAGAAFSVKDLAISGRDLSQELGLRPGPLFGEILRALLDEVVEEPALNERSRLLQRAAELAKNPPAPQS
ncbi:MAG TPA: HD domain-containing protein [Polyangiaceae bacterium]|nr:HD domain-containing protein [Polyangiaceae bacterium]